jgi:hypothetical protein
MNTQLRIACTMVTALAFGCGVEPGNDGDTGQGSEELVSPNGVSLNGVSLNGVSLNGVSLNGVSLNGVSLNGVSLNGTTLTGVSVTSSKIVGSKNGKALKDKDFESAIFTGTLSNGQSLKVRIDSATTGAAPNADTAMYGVSYQTSSGWTRMCGSDTSGNQILAIPMPGTFNSGWGVAGGGSYTADSTQITFGCRGFALAKCVEMGYKYWNKVPGDSSRTLLNHTVACTRMLRADYCGDGASWTVNGTPINLYDAAGIQGDTELLWPFEAEWSQNGASCVSPTSVLRWTNMSATPPTCLAAKKSATCGLVTHFSTSTLLMDEYKK